jgi:para-nitrobenzyl esterase
MGQAAASRRCAGNLVEPIVETRQGKIRGDFASEDGVRAFRGIPYAAPPIGNNRWRAPQAPGGWTGVRDCRTFSAVPIQQYPDAESSLFPVPGPMQSEDCLFLNVWTQAEAPDECRPVIVWLYPGAYQSGAGSSPICWGTSLARAGAILVTPNFRLSRLGFLAHPELTSESAEAISGNYGLLDQIAALEWVRDNIAAFGGNPNCVTLFGVSSGASSASLLMASPRARGLFHRVIAESGGSFGPLAQRTGVGDRWQNLPAAEETGLTWATAIGAQSLADLRALDIDVIRQASRFDVHDLTGAFDGVRPIIDNRVVPDLSHSCFTAGEQAAVPLLVGSAADEGLATVFAPDLSSYLQHVEHEFGELRDAFLRLYPATTDQEAIAVSLKSNGHRLFSWQSWRWAQLHAAAGHPVYYYRFGKAPPVPAGRYALQKLPRPLGAFHAASIFYAFGTFDSRDWAWSREDHALSTAMISAWVAFARSGCPASTLLPAWPAFDPGHPQVMRLGDEYEVSAVPDAQYLAFWGEYYGVAAPGALGKDRG